MKYMVYIGYTGKKSLSMIWGKTPMMENQMEHKTEHVILWGLTGMERWDLAPLCTIRTCIDIYPLP